MNSSLSINSAISFAAAFLLLHFFNEFATASVAAYFGLKPIMYLQAIKYNAYDNWTPYIVNRTLIASSIVNVLSGLAFLRLFIAVKKQNNWYRLFFLWCSVIGFIMFFGKILSIPFYEFKPDPPGHIALGVIVGYHYVGEPFKWMLSVFSVLLIIGSGLFFSYQFLRNAETKDQIKKGAYRRDFIFKIILIPYLAGMFVVAAVNFPDNLSTLLIYFMVGLGIILSALSFSGRTSKVLLYREEPQKISYFAMGMLGVLVVFYLTLYSKGIGCKGYLEFLLCCNCTG
jgi:hypothetical protein